MQYRRFGRTGLSMPVFSCGGMRYQDGWKDKPLAEIDPATQTNLEATVGRAIDAGMGFQELLAVGIIFKIELDPFLNIGTGHNRINALSA